MTKPGRDYIPADIRDEFEERAAIREYEAGMTRDAAERAAMAEVCKRYGLPAPQILNTLFPIE